eukprot:11439696-Ditylum_brightwellii.AAC.1
MRSVHECTDMGVVEDVVDRKHNDEDLWNDDVKSVFEEDWEDEGIFITSREQIDVDGHLWNDDRNSNSEESSNVGDGRKKRAVKILNQHGHQLS